MDRFFGSRTRGVKPRRVSVLVWAVLWACSGSMPRGPDAECSVDGEIRCSAEGVQLLECRAGLWATLADCRGPERCQAVGGEVRCDSTGNTVGHRCLASSEGRVRCEPDGGTGILRCVGGTLTLERACVAPERCAQGDGGLVCG